jgi:hypothetical protein
MGSDPQLDHLVVAARTLEEGSAWVEAKLGVSMGAVGKHALMGTHNRLLKLDEGRYLEVIAIDPDAPPPGRARWYDLDAPEMKTQLDIGPALIHWVDRTDDIEARLRGDPEPVEILSISRGPYRWRMGVRPDGRRPRNGRGPTLIQWEGPHPWDALPETRVRLVDFDRTAVPLRATFATPSGARTIP